MISHSFHCKSFFILGLLLTSGCKDTAQYGLEQLSRSVELLSKTANVLSADWLDKVDAVRRDIYALEGRINQSTWLLLRNTDSMLQGVTYRATSGGIVISDYLMSQIRAHLRAISDSLEQTKHLAGKKRYEEFCVVLSSKSVIVEAKIFGISPTKLEYYRNIRTQKIDLSSNNLELHGWGLTEDLANSLKVTVVSNADGKDEEREIEIKALRTTDYLIQIPLTELIAKIKLSDRAIRLGTAKGKSHNDFKHEIPLVRSLGLQAPFIVSPTDLHGIYEDPIERNWFIVSPRPEASKSTAVDIVKQIEGGRFPEWSGIIDLQTGVIRNSKNKCLFIICDHEKLSHAIHHDTLGYLEKRSIQPIVDPKILKGCYQSENAQWYEVDVDNDNIVTIKDAHGGTTSKGKYSGNGVINISEKEKYLAIIDYNGKATIVVGVNFKIDSKDPKRVRRITRMGPLNVN